MSSWELTRTLHQQLEHRAEELRAALQRFEEGTYGACSQCGNPINPERLRVLPDADICMVCARKES